MPVALPNLGHAVHLVEARSWHDLHRVLAQPHRPPLGRDTALLGEEVDHRVRRSRIELRGVRLLPPQRFPGERNRGDLHPEADPEVGHPGPPGVVGSEHLPLDPPFSKSARNQDPREPGECPFSLPLHHGRRDPAHVDAGRKRGPGVVERLEDRQVRIAKLDVLAYDPDANGPRRSFEASHELLPRREVLLSGSEIEPREELRVQPFRPHREGHAVDRGQITASDHVLAGHVAEQGDLVPQADRELDRTARDDEVGLDPRRAQLLHRMLGGLRLEL